ncbi:AI-2E family transporter [Peribacillus sp. NPDC096379]|uniref:AI-2E family transporter n=1 Tax=Peribacillus sp. NPDC096379 TaxID=3364393 RepID=UPI0038245E0F
MNEVMNFLKSKGFTRFLTLLILIIVLYSMGSMVNLVLFTFIFTFLMGRLQNLLSAYANRYVRINPKLILAVLYTVFVLALAYVLYKYLPVITMQISELISQIFHFYQHPPDNQVIHYIKGFINSPDSSFDIPKQFNAVYGYISGIGSLAIQILISIILSLFILLEKDKIIRFTSKFKHGKFGQFFLNLEHFGKKFTNSFGKVIEVQFLIATTNSVLSILFLWILGFPQLLGLGIMIFFLGLIPVAGVIISLIPLCMIAYSIGGLTKVIAVLVMVAVIHSLEAYVLNPKFMSVKTNLPTFFTLAVLLVSEHFLGTWGLIIGIPIFIFVIDMLELPNETEKIPIKKNKVK